MKSYLLLSDGVKKVEIQLEGSNDDVAKLGDSLRCYGDGNPAPAYEWFQSMDNESIGTGEMLNVQIPRLFIYQCRATNVVNNRTSSPKIILIGKRNNY